MVSLVLFLYVAAFGLTLWHAVRADKVPLWLPVLLICLALLLGVIPK